ncbi:PLC-like phosphodiesterase [Gonapodya prolifera JEL478]|uniref:PLC-like phosphodiesterase n=1 Tax=Gonapodya prolifera (strain JEL478) TaxID=1344416 RepID=A0A138ZYN3_GONPJ|nr:PLC-like phosphodiesterase [Gonapodya prolifera JEL478]|eukprot:KXS09614.1 PLC-like phosphodiesterase [Gonapodya prolifera JEL478]
MKVLAILLTGILASAVSGQKCNGFAALCTKPLNQVAFPGTHNSYAVGSTASANQNFNISRQLADGIRMFELDLHLKNGVVELCHTQCDNVLFLDAGPLSSTLTVFKSFLDSNPGEVVIITFENYDNVPAATVAPLMSAAGLTDYAYAASAGTTTWPTLADLISQNKRLIVFTDRLVDYANYPWLMLTTDFFSDTFYIYWNITALNADCSIDRPSGVKLPLLSVHHAVSTPVLGTNPRDPNVVYVPAVASVATTNSYSNILLHVATCQNVGYFPNFVRVDYYDQGDIFRAVDAINSVEGQRDGGYKTTANTTTAPAAASTGTGTSGTVGKPGGSHSIRVRGLWEAINALTILLLAVTLTFHA